MIEPEWTSAHAFYHGDLDLLITRAVAPLVAEIDAAGLAAGWFFLRYWDGGPHLRLRILPAGAGDRAAIEDLVTEHFADFFERRPAGWTMAQRDYAELAAVLARREQVPDPSRVLYPNNSLHFITYLREHGRYGFGPSVRAVERHFGESSRIALRVLALGAPLDRRAHLAHAIILLTWFCFEPDAARLAAWITGPGRASGAPGGAGEANERSLRLAREMRALLASPRHLAGTGALAAWTRSVTGLRDALAPLASAGAFTPPERGWEGPGGILAVDPAAGILPVLDVCAHLVCNRLGLSVSVEQAVRRSAAVTVAALAEGGGGP